MPWIRIDSMAYWCALVSAFLAVAIWESLQPWKELSTTTARRWGSHSLIYLVSTVAIKLVYRSGPVIVALAVAASPWGLLNKPGLPFAARCVLAVLAVDLIKYATHRTFHGFSFLWRIHQVHHSDPDFDVSTAFRVHPLELLMTQGSVLAGVALLAPPPLAVIAAEVLGNVISLFEHGNTALPEWLDKALGCVLITPDLHRIHHSEEIAEQNSNYGELFPWWDRLFGTFVSRPVAGREAMVTGLKGFQTPASLGVSFMLTQPFRQSAVASASGGIAPLPVAAVQHSPSEPGLARRLLLLASLFACELIAISIWLDGDMLSNATGIAAEIRSWGAWIVRGVVGFAAVFVTFAFLKYQIVFERISAAVRPVRLRWTLFALHLMAMTAFIAFSFFLYQGKLSASVSNWVAADWLISGLLAIAFAALTFVPLTAWNQMARGSGYLWLYSALAAVGACLAGNVSRSAWDPVARLTFYLVKALLSPFVPSVFADPTAMRIGTSSFRVWIAPECSGFEGAGLILAFGLLWLCMFRKECRFPHAFLLLPAGVVLIYVLNAVRIAALILIGNSGARQIATGGFHSQAGWIAFSGVALGFSVVARRMPWLAVREMNAIPAESRANPTAPYLMPLLAILAAGMLATAFSGGFDWLYPVRFFAAATALWVYRSRYQASDLRLSWFGPAVGIFVFAIWIAADYLGRVPDHASMPLALQSSSIASRVIWIAFRVLAAAVTVPVAEELAFRGYLLRRLVSPDFECVSLGAFQWSALVLSSLAFGLMHGQRWIVATIAGLLFGAAAIRRGRLMDAVIAHATANALLAAYVLAFDQWQFW